MVQFPSSFKISHQTNKMPRNDSKNKISPEKLLRFSFVFSRIFENLKCVPHTSNFTKNIFLSFSKRDIEMYQITSYVVSSEYKINELMFFPKIGISFLNIQ